MLNKLLDWLDDAPLSTLIVVHLAAEVVFAVCVLGVIVWLVRA